MSLRRPSAALFAAVSAIGLWLPASPAFGRWRVGGRASARGRPPPGLPPVQPDRASNRASRSCSSTLDPTAGPGHSFTEDVPEGVTPKFDSGIVPPGTFKDVPNVSSLPPGTYKVRCKIHVVVNGTLTVSGA